MKKNLIAILISLLFLLSAKQAVQEWLRLKQVDDGFGEIAVWIGAMAFSILAILLAVIAFLYIRRNSR
jgi:hypothetical protein